MKSNASTRKLLPTLMLLLAASSVAACSVSTPSAKAPINLPSLPPALAQTCKPEEKDCIPACPYAVAIPEQDLSQEETEKLWRRDRVSLRNCRNSMGAIITYYETLRSNLSTPED